MKRYIKKIILLFIIILLDDFVFANNVIAPFFDFLKKTEIIITLEPITKTNVDFNKIVHIEDICEKYYWEKNDKMDSWYCYIENFGRKQKLVNGLYNIEDGRYYFTESGILHKGFLDDINGNTMYFSINKDSNEAKALIGFNYINNNLYFFDNNGIMLKNISINGNGIVNIMK